MQYLMIRNPGEAPAEGFTVLGVSTTRFSGSSQTIGQFGSGAKHAVNLLLRNSVNPIVYSGLLKMEFYTEPLPVNDGLSEHTYSQVWVRYGGTDKDGKSRSGARDLSFTLEHGVYDWTDMAMGLREFVANALDRTFRENGDFKAVEISVTDKPRAKAGYTAVFVPLTPDVQKFFTELPKRFLHFRESHLLSQRILPKAGRNLDDKEVTMVYKKGVFVRAFSSDDLPSIYDYNLGDELKLDENRHVDDYVIKGEISRVICNAAAEQLVPVMRAVINGEKVFEAENLDSYRLKDAWASEDSKKAQAEQWQTAWKAAAGEEAVAVADKPNLGDYVQKKGYTPRKVKSETWFAALESKGVLTDSKVLTDADKKGTTFSEATPDMLLAVDKVWNMLEQFDMLNGREKPPVRGFTEVMDGEGQRLGYYDRIEKAVYLHTDIGTGQSPMLLQTALEEVVHHTTGAGDMSRDLQDFLFRLVVKLAL